MYKGPQFLVNAMLSVLKEAPSTFLIFVGDGPMRTELHRLAIRLGVNQNIKFVGRISEFEKAMYYKASDLFVLPSTMNTESFGIVNLEAMAAGLPIVASRIGGIPDVVKDWENGILVPPCDSKSLANAIVYLLKDDDLRKKMSINSNERVNNYSWTKIAEVTQKVYREISG